jgi:acetyltransferase-like isoleucine patch superfamily enzyme
MRERDPSAGSRSVEESNTRDLDKNQLIRQRMFASRQSIGAKYQSLVTGRGGLWSLLRYELTTALLGGIPGAIGLAIRRFAYRGLFKRCGNGLVLGRGVTIRHADKISLGRNVVIDDFCVLDGRGSGDGGLVIGDEVIINRGCIVQSKFGPIRIGSGTNIGAGTHVCSMGGIEIGQSVLVTGGCTISGGRYHTEDLATPIMQQGAYTSGPISIGDGSWLGMKVLVLDGVTVGRGCAIGAGAVVNQDLPDYAVAAGVPARVTRIREAVSQQSGTTSGAATG